jgi:HTH-type transcriptional regulator / antitoxin HigA
MTTGLKMPSSYYMTLINHFPPRPITDEAELAATQAQINSLLDKATLNQDDRDYLKVLGMLVYDYEERHEPIPSLQGSELLQALMEEANLQAQDLIPIFENETIVLEVLSSEREITDRQINELATRFQISPSSFR